jgi:hypothetical protein
MIQIRKFYHRGDFQIGLYFGFDTVLKQKVRSRGTRLIFNDIHRKPISDLSILHSYFLLT